jgi:ABC-type branched-subunit amino acid transport system substrate-binding protein
LHHFASRSSRLTLPLLALIFAAALAACSSGISSGSTATKPPPAAETPAQNQAPPEPAAAPVVPVTQEPAPAPTPPPQKPYASAALLLPLTGPSAATGAALLNAAQLALFEVADRKFTLLPYDTKGTAEGAAAAAQQALANSPDIVLGPLFSAEVKAAEPYARRAHVPMIALSADRTVAGEGVYVLGFLPGPQALRVIAFAVRRGHQKLAILAPSTDYGQRVVEEVTNGAPQLGVTVANPQFYDEAATDLSGPIKHLVKSDPANPGDPGFDALLLPDEGARLRQVAASLPALGVDPTRVKLLGTMLWDDSNPGAEPTLAGGWYPAPAAANHVAFQDRYAKAFGSKPPRIASLAYDATALAAVLARHEPRDFSPASLTNRSGFAGVDGLFRLLSDGTAERGYTVLEVVNGGAPREIDPAPANFNAPGS